MSFVKLDCAILKSSIWLDKDARDIFITALLMASPLELREPMPQLEVNSNGETGFVVPLGWYGFVDAAGSNIAATAGLPLDRGMAALTRCGEPEGDSRTPDHDGRRMVRVRGGYIILNYDFYRKKDHTTAERSARYRARKQSNGSFKTKRRKPSRVTPRGVTQAEAYSESSPNGKDLRPKRSQMWPEAPRDPLPEDAL